MATATIPTRPVSVEWDTVPHQLPDFAAIVAPATCKDPHCDGCDGCETSWWTPRTADLLHTVAELAYDTGMDLVADEDLAWVTDDLPPVVAAQATPAWVSRFLGCYFDLKTRMEHGELPLPRCTGEEMALHLMLDEAQARIDDLGVEDQSFLDAELLHVFPEMQNGLPRNPGDYDIDLLRDILFEDHDVLSLFSDPVGSNYTDSLAATYLGMVNLAAADWFTPFRADLPVAAFDAEQPTPTPQGAVSPQVSPQMSPQMSPQTSTGRGADPLTLIAARAAMGSSLEENGVRVDGLWITTAHRMSSYVSDPQVLIGHALEEFGWDLKVVWEGQGIDGRLGLNPQAPVGDLFSGLVPLWEQLVDDDRQRLCADALTWIQSCLLFDVPGVLGIVGSSDSDAGLAG